MNKFLPIFFLLLISFSLFGCTGSDTFIIQNTKLQKFFDGNVSGDFGAVPSLNPDGNLLEVTSLNYNKDTNVLSGVSNLVPYSGATTNVDLGSQSLLQTNFEMYNDGTNQDFDLDSGQFVFNKPLQMYGVSSNSPSSDLQYTYKNVLSWHIDQANYDGALVIKAPDVVAQNTMLLMKIRGYNYNTGGGYWEVNYGGYWNGSNTRWLFTGVTITGTPPFTSVYAMKDSTNHPAVVLGNFADVDNWDYPQIWVDVDAGFNNQSAWSNLTATLDTNGSTLTTTSSTQPTIKEFTNLAGNKGIGTTTPATKLQVTETNAGAMTFPVTLHNSSTATNTGVGFAFAPSTNSGAYKGAIGFERTTDWARGKVHIMVDGATDSSNATVADAKLTVEYTGNVGIGTTTPSAKLDVGGAFTTPPTSISSMSPTAYITSNTTGISGVVMGNAGTGTNSDYRFIIRDALDSYIAFTYGGSNRTSTAVLGLPANTYGGLFTTGASADARHLLFATAQAKDIIFGTNNTERMRITSGGNIGMGTTTPKSTQNGLDISSGSLALILGADASASTRTDNTTKNARIGGAHYVNSEEPFAFILGQSNSTENSLNWGGGSALLNSATSHRFWTGSDYNTTTGSIKFRIDDASARIVPDNYPLIFGAGSDDSLYHDGTNFVIDPASQLVYVDGNISATGFITRTSTYNKSTGKALPKIKDANVLKDASGIKHEEFYGYKEFEVTDYSRPVIIQEPYQDCVTIDKNVSKVIDVCEDDKLEEEVLIKGKCEKETVIETIQEEKCTTKYKPVTTFPHKKLESGVDIVEEIELLRQALYELKTEMCVIDKKYSWCS